MKGSVNFMGKIVTDERELAERAIEKKQLGRKAGETLSLVARYYYQVEGYSKSEVRNLLDRFLVQCKSDVSLVRWEPLLDKIAKTCDKEPLIKIDKVSVTEAEMDIIDSLPSRGLSIVAFTMLCIAKYWYKVKPKYNMWVNCTDRDIMKLANMNNLSVRQQNELFFELKKRKLIRFGRRVDNLNIQVLFADETSPVCMEISDFRNIGNQYRAKLGEPYFKCAMCGKTVRRKSNAQKYCAECAEEIYFKNSVESVMRKRDGNVLIS